MKKNNDYEKGDTIPDVDYGKNKPEETIKILNNEIDIIEKKTKLTWDGRQFIVRIPKAIADVMNLKEKNELRFRLERRAPGEGQNPKLKMWFE